MKKVLLIMAAALMTMTQCRKQETVPAMPSANTIKMTITAGPGAKTDITDEGRIKWTSGDKLYVSDGENWLGSLDLYSGAGSATGKFTGEISGISDGTTCHFFYLGHDNGMTGATGTANAVISFASQDGSREGAFKYHLGHGSAKVTVSGGVATGAVAMTTEIAIAHLKLKMNGEDYTGSVTMDVSNTMTVSPDGDFSGSGNGNGITIGGTSGDRYVTLIPTTGTESVNVNFSGSATGSMTFGHGIQANNLYGMKNGIEVTLNKVPVTGVRLDKTELSLEVGETETLVATVTPDNATYKDVTWISNATNVATVENGVVTAVGAGTATITVTTVDGGKTATCYVTVTAPSYLPGEFTVSSGKTVKFSKGNLWYDGRAFHFEENQLGTQPASNGQWVSNHVSHFKWSAVKNAVTDDYEYSGDLFCASNFTVDGEAGWTTLSNDEWVYLMNTRTVNGGNGEGKSYQRATVNGVYGMILYPDSYTAQSSSTSYSGDTWTSMESAGVVFLPAAGKRMGTDAKEVGSVGNYWSSSPGSEYNADYLTFSSNFVRHVLNNRMTGFSVRLVR